MNHSDDKMLVAKARAEGVLTLTLGAAPAHPLSLAMIEALETALARAANDESVGVVVIHGPGHIFCAGHDLKEIARHRGDNDLGRAYLTRLFTDCGRMMKAVTQSPKPTVAMVEGIATAGGLQLVAACDLAFVSEAASFALPGVKNNGFCTTPAVAVARNLPRKLLMEMALSGEVYDAEWAREAGLVNRVLPAADLAGFTHDFTRRLAKRYGKNVADGKRTLYHQLDMPLEQAYAHATDVMIGHFMDPARIERERATGS